MSTAPIINVSSLASSGASVSKAGNSANASDQSFGQVLSQEVNSRNNTNAASANNANSSSSSAPAPTPPPASSSGSDGKTGKSKSSDKSAQATSPSSTTSTNTDAGTASASAQLLALVTNVQQAAAGSPNAASTATNAISGTLPAGSAVVQAQFIASSAEGNATNTETGTSPSSLLQQGTTADSTSTDASNLALQAEKQNALASPAGAVAEIPLDLTATAEKNIQAGLAALDSNAVKIDQAAQTAAQNVINTANTQPAMVNAQALPSNPGDKLTPSVGSTGWDQALGQKVVWMVAGGQQNASLTLNPPDLGPMQVVLSVTNSHATVTFSASQPEVRQALETALPKLREMLGDAGIQLGQASINSGSAQQQNPSFQQRSSPNSSQSTGNTIETAISSTGAIQTSAGLGLVDTFA